MVGIASPVRVTRVAGRRVALAWGITLLVSTLPNILWQELGGAAPAWLFWAKVALLVALAAVAPFWPLAGPLRGYVAIVAAVYLLEEATSRLGMSATWQGWFGGEGVPFTTDMLGTQLRRVAVALAVIGVLYALGYRRRAAYLAVGDLHAPAAGVRWLGIPPGTSWARLGPIVSLCIGLGLTVFLVLAGRPSGAALTRALPMLPMILLLAAINAFSEEMTYRAAFLAPLVGAVGRTQAVALTAAFFGIGHYYGVPYGVVGVLMAGFLGWLLGKAMVETRGFFWPWFIHLIQDVLIFSFMGIGAVVAGGA